MKFSTKGIKFEILSSSSISKTAVFFENWITMPFFSRELQGTIYKLVIYIVTPIRPIFL
jgi:hypothetical protein